MGRSDSDLVRLIIKGDMSAFEELYERYHELLFFLALKYLKNESLSEDAIQDIFTKLWQNRGNLDPGKSVKYYLLVNMKNHIMNMIRNQHNKLLLDGGFDEANYSSESDVWQDLIHSEQKSIMDKGLDELSGKRRKVFELKMVFGFSNSEIAKKLSISVNTVRVHYYHALKFMREFFKKNAGL